MVHVFVWRERKICLVIKIFLSIAKKGWFMFLLLNFCSFLLNFSYFLDLGFTTCAYVCSFVLILLFLTGNDREVILDV
jgi:hypothetical protein